MLLLAPELTLSMRYKLFFNKQSLNGIYESPHAVGCLGGLCHSV